MTADSIISRVDEIKPNSFTQEQKLDFISELDSHLFDDIIKPYNPDATEFVPYTSVSQDVIASDRYKDMYVFYIEAKIDFNNKENTDFNNDMVMYNNAYMEFNKAYIRNHRKDSHWSNL